MYRHSMSTPMFSSVQNNQLQGGVAAELSEGTPQNTETRVQHYKRSQLLLTSSSSLP